MKGNKIVLSDKPRGVQMECTLNGALKPGTLVQIDTSAGMDDNGRVTVEPVDITADGDSFTVAVLDAMFEWGQLATEAYADGAPGRIYFPVFGERLNVLLADVSGTGDAHTFGAKYGVEDGTGKLLVNSSFDYLPFQILEDLSALTADALGHMLFINEFAADIS
jgi:hypothetical protein